MSGGSQQTSSQTTNSAPWEPSQGYLEKGMKKANKFMKNDVGFNSYPGQGWVDFSGETNEAHGQMSNLARQGNPFYGGASDYTKGLIGGNYNLDQSGYRNLMGQGPNTEGDYRGMMGGGPSTEADYRALMDQVDPEFENVVARTANQLGDQIQRQFGGASYGSGSNASYLTQGVGDVVSKMRSDNFHSNQNLKAGLLNAITGVQQQKFANDQGLLNAITGVQQQNFDNRRGLLGDMSNLSQMDIQNRLAGLDRADSVYNSQYLPAERLAGVGAAKEAKEGEKLQSQMDKFYIDDMAKWNRLAEAMGVWSGTGAQGSRTQTSVSQPTDIWSKLLGGGLLLSQLGQ